MNKHNKKHVFYAPFVTTLQPSGCIFEAYNLIYILQLDEHYLGSLCTV